ncbi:hypothetical protein [Dactylosporangium sp. CS-033363]|uniref:hypothetical protein n=1 Tax=Dactylosporangium sp. CS-033363 TaxID=3239935 RepID=UPI003D8E20DF
MTITVSALFRAAALAAATAGTIFVAVQINHPPMVAASAELTEWTVRSCAKAVMAALALAGITGMYLRQYRRVGLLGLAGYLIFAAGYLSMVGVEIMAATVLPGLARTNPAYVNDVIVAAAGGHPAGDIGGLQMLFNLSGAGYMLGGLLFGIALFRSGVLARWASALLAAGTAGTASLAVLPESFNRPIAVPVGVALVGLGVSLWRNHASSALEDAPPVLQPAGR